MQVTCHQLAHIITVTQPTGGGAQRANCEAPERTGTDRRRQPCRRSDELSEGLRCKWYQENVLSCTKGFKFCVLYRENVLGGTKF